MFVTIALKNDSEDSGLDTASVASFESENEDHQEQKHTGGGKNFQYILRKCINSSFIGKKRRSQKFKSKGKFLK